MVACYLKYEDNLKIRSSVNHDFVLTYKIAVVGVTRASLLRHFVRCIRIWFEVSHNYKKINVGQCLLLEEAKVPRETNRPYVGKLKNLFNKIRVEYTLTRSVLTYKISVAWLVISVGKLLRPRTHRGPTS